MKSVLFVLFIVTAVQSNAQIRYIQGLIVTQDNDTIICLVPATSSFGDRVSIKKNKGGIEEMFPINKIKYLATGLNVFENVTFKKWEKELHKLMWLKLEGKLNLYLETVFNTGSSRSYTGGSLKSFNFNPPTKTYVIRNNDSTYLIEEDNFIETITPLIADNEEILRKVASKFYKYDDIETIIKKYNGLSETENNPLKISSAGPSQLFSDKTYRKIVETECDDNVFTKVETKPSIKGGESALADSLSQYLNNRHTHIYGKATFVFLVTKNSAILDIEKVSGEISKEKEFKKGLLAFSNMWIPALVKSRNVCAVVRLETEFEKQKITLEIICNTP